MESAKAEDEKLQMFFDGELAPEEEAAFRRELESSREDAVQLHELEQLRKAMQGVSADWAAKIDSDALFARIEADVSAPVIPINRPVERPALRAVPGSRERRVWGAAATGFAAAAAIFLAVIAWPEGGPQDAGQLAIRGSEVLEVDFGTSTGTIFEVEGGAGESLAVVWIDDEQVGFR